MKDITLKITGKQCYESHEEEQMEFVTDGKLYVRRISSSYDTPYGPLELEVLTSSVINRLDAADFRGNVDIEYHVSLSGMAESKNRLTIDVQ